MRLVHWKNWQFFLLFYLVIPYSVNWMIERYVKLAPGLLALPILFGLLSMPTVSWYYFTGMNLFRLIPDQDRPDINYFRIFFYSSIAHIVFTCITFIVPFFLWGSTVLYSVFQTLVFIPVTPFFICYASYTVSKALKKAEHKNTGKFWNFLTELLLMLFLVIGIWMIQPRVNKLFGHEKKSL